VTDRLADAAAESAAHAILHLLKPSETSDGVERFNTPDLDHETIPGSSAHGPIRFPTNRSLLGEPNLSGRTEKENRQSRSAPDAIIRFDLHVRPLFQLALRLAVPSRKERQS